MIQIKTFETGEGTEALDKKVNDWIVKNKIEVISVSVATRAVMITFYVATVVYRTKD